MTDSARITIEHGERIVTHTPPFIECDLAAANHILTAQGGPLLEETADGRLVLDSAGEVVYQRVGRNRWEKTRDIGIYRRVLTDG